MHIRVKGDRIIFIRAWWSTELKKTIRKQIASCPSHVEQLPETVRTRVGSKDGSLHELAVNGLFEDAEIKHANEWFEALEVKRTERRMSYAPEMLITYLSDVTQVIKSNGIADIGSTCALDILSKIVDLELELKRVGINKGALKARIKQSKPI